MPTRQQAIRDKFLSDYNQKVIHARGEFFQYDDNAGVWRPVKDLIVDGWISDIIEAMDAAGGLDTLTASLVRNSRDLIRARLALADDTLLGTNPDFIACTNGALHIQERNLYPHDPDLLLTNGVGFDYDPHATAPTLESLLEQWATVTGPETIDFLQEFVGLSLTTNQNFELTVWLKSVPGAGKSTLLTGLQTVMGDLAGVLSIAALEQRFGLGGIAGKTFLYSTERIERDFKGNEILNAIVSGDRIQIEQKHKQPFEIIPTAKIMWAMNSWPNINAVKDDGFWRRVYAVELPRLIKFDTDAKDRIKTEAAGILNWALDGLQRLTQRNKILVPDYVKQCTAKFKRDSNRTGLFLDDVAKVADPTNTTARTQAAPLYDRYKLWSITNGYNKLMPSNQFKDSLEQLGFMSVKPGNVTFWLGIEL